MALSVFLCYAHEDEELLEKLKTHLKPLQRQGLIDVWHDKDIDAGVEWEPQIDRYLNTAHIILLLISPDFIASDYCYGVEMKKAIERHKRGEARIIPIILRNVYWQDLPFSQLKALPADAKPVTDPDWQSLDKAFFTVVAEIRTVILSLQSNSAATQHSQLVTAFEHVQASDRCPYRGLQSFTEEHAAFFFGRELYIDRLLNRLKMNVRFLPVFGPSGSGKSSVVQAGLIPALRRGAIGDSHHWGIIVIRPAVDPFKQLPLNQQLAPMSQDLCERARLWFAQHSHYTRLTLVIDPFEELLTPGFQAQRRDFVRQVTALLDSSLPVTVILVMRDDFYNLFAEDAAMRDWSERSGGPVQVPQTLTVSEVTAIVQKPAQAVGLRLEEGLVDLIVRDALEATAFSAEEGPLARFTILPLLEFALTQLWERRQDDLLQRSAYSAIGGVTGGLTQWADRVFYGLDSDAMRQRARRIFTDLVHLGDENQKPPDSRQSMPLTELCRHPHEQEDIRQLVQRLADGKLLITTYDPQGHQEIVEIIHDALLWGWSQMRQWLQSDRAFLTWHQEMTRRARAWVETNTTHPARREKEKLLRGSELKEARAWHKQRSSEISQAEREFIEASWHIRQRRTITGIMGGVVVTLVVSEGLLQWLQPRFEPYIDIIQFSKHKGPVYCVAWSPEATRLASGSADRTVWVYEAAGNPIYQYTGHYQTVTALSWSPEGFRIASASADATVQVWYSDGLGSASIYNHHTGPVQSVSWSPQPKSTLVASGGRDTRVYVWDASDGKTITTYTGHTGPVNAVAWSPDGKLIASGSGQDPETLRGDNSVHVWEATTGKKLNVYTSHKSHVRAVAWSPDQKYIASAGWDQTVQVWTFSSTQPLYTYLGHRGAPVNAVSWSPDGKLIASAGGDGTVQVWEALNGNPICSYEQHKRSVESVAWAPKTPAKRLASASDDTLVRLWQLK